MIYLTPELDANSLTVLRQIDELKKRIGSMVSQPRRWDGLLRRTTFAKAIRGSNTIEGYNVTVDDAIAAVEGEDPLEADVEAWREVVGYRAAMTYVLQLANDPHFRYSTDLVRSLHYMMLSHTLTKSPGQWRPGYVYVFNETKQEKVYEGPDAGLVPSLMDEFVRWLESDESTHYVVKAAMAHLNLTMIHPFRDGNGRMARCLQTLVLARGGQHLHPAFSSIEEYLGRNTPAYYDVLASVGEGAWHPKHDALPWVKFCLTAHFRQASTMVNRFERMRMMWDALDLEVKRLGLHERTVLALVDAAWGLKVRNPTYRKAAEVSENLASRDLKLLVDQGLLEPRGEKRGRFYVASAVLQAIARESNPPSKLIEDPFKQLSLGL